MTDRMETPSDSLTSLSRRDLEMLLRAVLLEHRGPVTISRNTLKRMEDRVPQVDVLVSSDYLQPVSVRVR